MALEHTKATLERLRGKYTELLSLAKADIKPNDAEIVRHGYSYNGIDPQDGDFIYQSICALEYLIRDVYGPIFFDVDHYLTDKIALKHLREEANDVQIRWDRLESIAKKYDPDLLPYPLEVSLMYHQEIGAVLKELMQSDEVLAFEHGKSQQDLEKEINALKFENFWKRKKWKYIIHLLAFVPFIATIMYLLWHREKHDWTGAGTYWLAVIIGIVTILFNLLFNNHNSFKDSFKLLIKKTATESKEKARKEFLKQ